MTTAQTMTEQPTTASRPAYRAVRGDVAVTAVLLGIATLGWWWTARAMDHDPMSGDPGMAEHSMTVGLTLGSFLVAWVAMMAAMMLPSVAPVVALYRRAVAAGRAAPLPVFLLGYLLVWSLPGLPVYWVWRRLEMPLADGEAWAGRVAAAALIAAAVWQVGPVKAMCLRHCRSPLSFFMQHGGGLRRPATALRLGATHGAFCFGCCWLLMVVLVALGTMNLIWMAALAAVIFLEKLSPAGERVAQVTALLLGGLGVFLLVDPTRVASLT